MWLLFIFCVPDNRPKSRQLQCRIQLNCCFFHRSRKVPIDKLATTFIDALAIDIVQKKAMAERAPAHIDDRAVACVASFIRLKIAARAGYPVVS